MSTTLSPETTFDIVPASRSDMPMIADFVRSSADWYRPIVDEKDMSEHEVGERWAEENYRKRDFYIGKVDDTPIGTISLQTFGDYAYLGYIYLDVEQVGNGHGQRLMKFAESVARKRKLRGLALIAHPEATWAKRAYLKYGFEITASDKRDVLSWNNGVLRPYYEEQFELYLYEFNKNEFDAKEAVEEATLHAAS